MSYSLPAVTSKETAESFLAELHKQGHLYHPEELAFDCLRNSGLSYESVVLIERNMQLCFIYLPDPCETVLRLFINAANR